MSRVAKAEKDPTTQGHTRPVGKRPVPFLGPLIVAFVILPTLFLISRLIMLWDPATGILVAHAWFVSGLLIAVIAIGVGMLHAKRTTFIVKHVAITLALVGTGGDLYTLAGFHHRFMNVVAVFGTAILWGSWMLYRIDVFRAKATGESGDSWGDLIGLAKSRPKRIKATEAQVTFDVEHGPGETHQDVVRGVAQLADQAGVITGRATATQDERGGLTHVTWSMANAFEHWRMFPGPSHPGATFAAPFRTAYYENGEDQWFSFAPTPDGFTSPVTSFRSGQATFVGAAGATGMGKSGFLNNTAGEGLTRWDCHVVWVDAEKLMQNAGWCLDQLALAAGSPAQAKVLTRGLRGLAEYRVGLLGQAALDSVMDPSKAMMGREWSPTVAVELGIGAVLIIVDEADTIIRTKAWEWLAARGRSLGMFLCIGAPRVSTAEVSALLRGSVATWKTFGVGDNYSGMFTLPDDIKETVDPSRLRESGLHYLTGAPGIPRQRWAELAREFKNDTRLLRAMVLRARASTRFIEFTAEEQRWLGDAWLQLRPEVLMKVRPAGPSDHSEDDAPAALPVGDGSGVDQQQTQDVPSASPVEDDDEDDEREPMRTSAEGTVIDGDGAVAIDVSAIDAVTAAAMAEVDPSEPVNQSVPAGAPVGMPHTKPQVSEEVQNAAINKVITDFAAAGRTQFSNQEMQDALPVEVTAWTLSRRLHELCEGKRMTPPGIELERDENSRRGRFQIVFTQPKPHRPTS